ncbi:MAG: hypothetical protein IRY98_10770, partial [Alicyclobacillaceae bacterium]|nr:hypothetical protein [Alicyclobacillaceae bacterium]
MDIRIVCRSEEERRRIEEALAAAGENGVLAVRKEGGGVPEEDRASSDVWSTAIWVVPEDCPEPGAGAV